MNMALTDFWNLTKELVPRSSIFASSHMNTLEKITRAGGKILEEMDMDDMGRHAFCEDPNGNVPGLMWENPDTEPPKGPPK